VRAPLALSKSTAWESTRVGRWLLRTPVGSVRYVASMLAAAIIPSLAVPFLLGWLFNFHPEQRSVPISGLRLMFFAVAACVVAPLIETLLMFPVLAVFKWITADRIKVAALSAIFWGGAHVVLVAPGSWPAGWLFFVLSAILLAWRPVSFGKAYRYTVMVHALNNMTALALILLLPD
jgi:hypothetical protein